MSSDAIQVVSINSASEQEPEAHVNGVVRVLRRIRAAIGRNRLVEVTYKVALAIVGGLLTIGGLILVPLPGPGWLVVFAGLAVLATEFHWAKRVAHWLKRQLDRFWVWWRARREARRASRA